MLQEMCADLQSSVIRMHLAWLCLMIYRFVALSRHLHMFFMRNVNKGVLSGIMNLTQHGQYG